MKNLPNQNLYKKTNQNSYNKPIRNLIDSLYRSIYKLRKRVIDKEKYIKFLKTSLEECGRDYKSEFKQYKKVLREKTIDPFINASQKRDVKGKNYIKNKRRREHLKKVVGSPMARQVTSHRIVVEDKVHQEGESSIDDSFHTCIDETEELRNNQRVSQDNSLPVQPVYKEEHMTEQERQNLIDFLVKQRQIQEEEEKQRYLRQLEYEKQEQEAFQRYLDMIDQYQKDTPAEAPKEELEEICTDSIPQTSSEPCKSVEKTCQSPSEKILDPLASLPSEQEDKKINKETNNKPRTKTKNLFKKSKFEINDERIANPFESLKKH